MSHFKNFLRCSSPAAAYVFSNFWNEDHRKYATCEAIPPSQLLPSDNNNAKDVSMQVTPMPPPKPTVPVPVSVTTPNLQTADANEEKTKEEETEKEELFHGLFPLRQLWKPKSPYPLWDSDWDSRKPESTGDKHKDHENNRYIRKHGITRHIILVRHGQYDETHREDEKRILTPLGREQAKLTGKRLAEMIAGIDQQFGPCGVKTIRVSNLARAKETADIIARELPDSVVKAEPDPILNEGRPCHTVPSGRVGPSTIKKTDEGHERIEEAFNKYFSRADAPELPLEELNPDENEKDSEATDSSEQNAENDEIKDIDELEPHPQHEFEIIVCHANVIRYFMCRALQLPPEAWLRMCTFNCSLNYVTIRPTGSVSVRMLGDIGHLGYNHSTFSMHHGFNW
mmetsp:Transcript_23465/g.34783  ORF Transcript_23465/g.34783 Transcript_23465/m.34783 type:complete len:398 (+) Transcript_23465:89-1282(+)